MNEWEKQKHNLDTLIDYEIEPLCYILDGTHILDQMKIPKKEYEGTRDLKDHLVYFTTKLKMHGASEGVKYKAFCSTLWGLASNWYFGLL